MPPLRFPPRVYRATCGRLGSKAGRVDSACAVDFGGRAGFARARVSPDRPATGGGGPEGKLRGRPPPPHCRAPDLGDGRGLNPSPDEREPADQEVLLKALGKNHARYKLENGCASYDGRPIDSARYSTGRHSWRFELGSTASGGSGATSSARTCSAAATSRSSRRTISATPRRWPTCSSTTPCWEPSTKRS